jgi:CRP-like cAMP-binding protein
MEELYNTISETIYLSENCKQKLAEVWTPLTVKKGITFFREEHICQYMYFVVKGSVNSYYFKNDTKVCEWFRFENDFFTSAESFLGQINATSNFEALEDTELLLIHYNDYQSHYLEFPELELFGRTIAEKYYVKNMTRLKYFQFQTIEEKYNLLLKSEPELLNRVSLGNIASYLGITQESLSRIRAKK